jgi:flagellar motor switch protein FliM
MTEVLTQDEIDQLLAAINGGDNGPDAFGSSDATNSGDAGPGAFGPHVSSRKIKIYDFKRPDKFSREQIYSLSIIHQTAVKLWKTLLSQYLQTDIHIHVASVNQVTYNEYYRSIPCPTSLITSKCLINNSPLPFLAVMEIDPAIYTEMLYYFFQGKTGSHEKPTKKKTSELTPLEQAALSNIAKAMLEKLSQAWSKQFECPVDFRFNSLETYPQFIKNVKPQEMTALITIEVRTSHAEGMINICLPYLLLEFILGRLSYLHRSDDYFSAYNNIKSSLPKNTKDAIALTLRIECFRLIVCLKDLKDMRKGEILYARHFSGKNRFKIMADDYVFFYGEAVIGNSNPGDLKRVKISEKINPYKEFNIMKDRDSSQFETSLDKLKVQVIVEFGRTVKTLKEIYQMGPGSIMEVDKWAGEPLDIFVNNVHFAKGEAVVIDENFGVRFTEIIENESIQAQAQAEEEPAMESRKEEKDVSP